LSKKTWKIVDIHSIRVASRDVPETHSKIMKCLMTKKDGKVGLPYGSEFALNLAWQLNSQPAIQQHPAVLISTRGDATMAANQTLWDGSESSLVLCISPNFLAGTSFEICGLAARIPSLSHWT
jgi:hypothetical protein